VADVTVAQGLTVEPGTIVVDDRGYNDYGLFARWTERRHSSIVKREAKERALRKSGRASRPAASASPQG
jgi:hypothetical protein